MSLLPRLTLTGLTLFTLGPLSGMFAEAAAAVPELISSSESEIRFKVRFDSPSVKNMNVGGTAYRFLSWPDLHPAGEPGEPGIPTKVFLVALPPEGEVRLVHTASQVRSVEGIKFVPLAEPKVLEDFRDSRPDAQLIPATAESPAYTSYRAPRASINSVGVERGLRIARVQVTPVDFDPVSGRAEWAAELDLRIEVSEGASPQTPRPGGLPAKGFARFVNPESAAVWSRPRSALSRQTGGIPDSWFDKAGGWVKLRVGENGIYRVSYEDLAAMGVPVENLSSAALRLFSGPLTEENLWDSDSLSAEREWLHVYEQSGFTEGFNAPRASTDSKDGMRENAIQVRDGGDGQFDAGDDLVFYGLGPDNFGHRYGLSSEEYYSHSWTNESIYWLGWDTQFSWEPRRVPTSDAVPLGTEALMAESATRIQIEKNQHYDPSMIRPGERWQRYFWITLTSSAVGLFDVDLPGWKTGTSFGADINLWGAARPTGGSAIDGWHFVRVTANEKSSDVVSWGGPRFVDSFSPHTLRMVDIPGSEKARFLVDVVNMGRTDWVHLVSFTCTYTREFAVTSAQSEFEVSPGAGARRLRFENAGDIALVWNVTDARNPGALTAEADGTALELLAPSEQRTFLALSEEGGLKTPVMEVDSRPGQWLRDTSSPLDYLVITYDEFDEAAGELADWRRTHTNGVKQTFVTRVVRISDVYDEFTYGMADPAALRYFLEYAYRYYGGEQAEPLQFCLLLGDHTYDPRRYEGFSAVDKIPTWEDNHDGLNVLQFGTSSYSSDDMLVRFDGPQDSFTDVNIGRLPVDTPAEAAALIRNKIIRSERNPDRGPWRTKVILVADDICQGFDIDTPIHMSRTEDLDRAIDPSFDRDKVYLYDYGEVCNGLDKPEAKQHLLRTWSEGGWLVNYTGHGGDTQLADEHVLDITDVPLLINDGRLPVFGAFSCSVGKFNNPTQIGLGEALIRHQTGGALGCAVATQVTYSLANSSLNHDFVDALFAPGLDKPAPIGQALMEAKNKQLVSVTNQPNKYAYFGDPASRLSVPDISMEIEGPGAIQRGELAQVGVSLTEVRQGSVDLEVNDAWELRTTNSSGKPFGAPYKRKRSTLFRGVHALEAAQASMQYVTPVTLREGTDARIRAYAWDDDWDGLAALAPLDAGGVASAPTDSAGPAVEVSLPEGGVFPGSKLTLALSDPSGIDLTQLFAFRGILLRYEDSQGFEVLREDLTTQFTYDVGSHTQGAMTVTVPGLTPDLYTLRITAYDNVANKSETSVELAIADPASPGKLKDITAWPNPAKDFTDVVFSLDRPSEVRIKIFSASGRSVNETSFQANSGRNSWKWQITDRAGDRVANGVYLMQITLIEEDGAIGQRHLERIAVYR